MDQFHDLNALDDWLLKEAIKQAELGTSLEEKQVPGVITALGSAWVDLYVTVLFEGEVANGGLPQFFENSAGALAPLVRDALSNMGIVEYADILTALLLSFGVPYPLDQATRLALIESDPAIKAMLEHGYRTIDVWSETFISARSNYAKNSGIIR